MAFRFQYDWIKFMEVHTHICFDGTERKQTELKKSITTKTLTTVQVWCWIFFVCQVITSIKNRSSAAVLTFTFDINFCKTLQKTVVQSPVDFKERNAFLCLKHNMLFVLDFSLTRFDQVTEDLFVC